MILIVVQLLFSYLLGSIPSSLIAGKVMRGIDIREHGSGNAGGTNTFRVLGWKAGLIVSLFDIVKGFIAVFYIANWELVSSHFPVHEDFVRIACGSVAILGHIWPLFAGFRGGKGVATAAGMMIALFPEAMAYAFLVFGIVLWITKYVSLSSILGVVTVPIALFIMRFHLDREITDNLLVFSTSIFFLILMTHMSNIKRLLKGTESRIGKKKSKI